MVNRPQSSSSSGSKPKYEILPNVNLYKNDTKYRQLNTLDFESVVENEEYKFNFTNSRWKQMNYFISLFIFLLSLCGLNSHYGCDKYVSKVEGKLDVDALFLNNNFTSKGFD